MMMGLEKSRNLELHGREEIECMCISKGLRSERAVKTVYICLCVARDNV
jgi:hypothetical protein